MNALRTPFGVLAGLPTPGPVQGAESAPTQLSKQAEGVPGGFPEVASGWDLVGETGKGPPGLREQACEGPVGAEGAGKGLAAPAQGTAVQREVVGVSCLRGSLRDLLCCPESPGTSLGMDPGVQRCAGQRVVGSLWGAVSVLSRPEPADE